MKKKNALISQNQQITILSDLQYNYLIYNYFCDNRFQTHLTKTIYKKYENYHIEKLPIGDTKPKALMFNQALKAINDFQIKFHDGLWRLRNPILDLEFENLRGYDAIVDNQWDATKNLLYQLDYSPEALELVFSHNNIDSGIYYSDKTVNLINFDYAACNYKIFDIATLINSYFLHFNKEYKIQGKNNLYNKYLYLFRRLSALLYAARYYQKNNKLSGNKFLELYFCLQRVKN